MLRACAPGPQEGEADADPTGEPLARLTGTQLPAVIALLKPAAPITPTMRFHLSLAAAVISVSASITSE